MFTIRTRRARTPRGHTMTWDRAQLLHLLKLNEDGDLSLMFRVNADESDVTVYVDCSDLFYWGCADAEELTPDDVPAIEQAKRDLGDADYWTGELWCARKRQMRPQGAWYGYCGTDGRVRRSFVPVAVEALFDAAGPDRTGQPDGAKSPRPADGRRWEWGGAPGTEPADFADNFKPGGKFGP